MGTSVVNVTGGSVSNAGPPMSLTIPSTTAGNLLVASVTGHFHSATFTITSTGWTEIGRYNATGGNSAPASSMVLAIYPNNPGSLTSFAVSWTSALFNIESVDIIVYELSTSLTSIALDGSVTLAQGTPVGTISNTASQNTSEIAITAVGSGGFGSGNPPVPSGWTGTYQPSSSANPHSALAFMDLSSTGSFSAAWGSSTGSDATSAIGALYGTVPGVFANAGYATLTNTAESASVTAGASPSAGHATLTNTAEAPTADAGGSAFAGHARLTNTAESPTILYGTPANPGYATLTNVAYPPTQVTGAARAFPVYATQRLRAFGPYVPGKPIRPWLTVTRSKHQPYQGVRGRGPFTIVGRF